MNFIETNTQITLLQENLSNLVKSYMEFSNYKPYSCCDYISFISETGVPTDIVDPTIEYRNTVWVIDETLISCQLFHMTLMVLLGAAITLDDDNSL